MAQTSPADGLGKASSPCRTVNGSPGLLALRGAYGLIYIMLLKSEGSARSAAADPLHMWTAAALGCCAWQSALYELRTAHTGRFLFLS